MFLQGLSWGAWALRSLPLTWRLIWTSCSATSPVTVATRTSLWNHHQKGCSCGNAVKCNRACSALRRTALGARALEKEAGQRKGKRVELELTIVKGTVSPTLDLEFFLVGGVERFGSVNVPSEQRGTVRSDKREIKMSRLQALTDKMYPN